MAPCPIPTCFKTCGRWLALASLIGLTGCTDALMKAAEHNKSTDDYFQPIEQQTDPVAPMVLRVVGYGAMSLDKRRPEAQRRLMAMRAARIDAYRAMAERVYGTVIQGNTTVRDMVVENDRLRTMVETYLHGARVVSSDVMPDGTVETLLEMVIDQGFRNCLETQNNQRVNVDCRVPLGNGQTAQFVDRQPGSGRAETPMPDTGFYFID